MYWWRCRKIIIVADRCAAVIHIASVVQADETVTVGKCVESKKRVGTQRDRGVKRPRHPLRIGCATGIRN